MSKKKIVAHYWVLQRGKDCDGYGSFDCRAFADIESARNNQADSMEWSDGMYYELTVDWQRVVDYCDEWDQSECDYEYVNQF